MRFLCLAGLVLGLFIQSSHAQSVVPAADGPKGSMPAPELMSRAALVVSGEGVDVAIEQRN